MSSETEQAEDVVVSEEDDEISAIAAEEGDAEKSKEKEDEIEVLNFL